MLYILLLSLRIIRFTSGFFLFRSTFECFQTKKIYRAPTRCMATSTDQSFSKVNVNSLLYYSFRIVLLVIKSEILQEENSCMITKSDERKFIEKETKCKLMNTYPFHQRQNQSHRRHFNFYQLVLVNNNDEIRIQPIVHHLKQLFDIQHHGDGVIVFGSFCVHFVADGLLFSFGILMHSIKDDLKLELHTVGIIASLFASLPLLLAPVCSAMVNKVGCRIMTMIGGGLCSFGLVVASFFGNFLGALLGIGIICGSNIFFPSGIFHIFLVCCCYFSFRNRSLVCLCASSRYCCSIF